MSLLSRRTNSHIALVLTAACALFLGACSSREERAKSFYERGTAYLAKKDTVHARLEFRNALQQKGDLLEAWRGLARIEEGERNWQAVASIWRKIVSLDPADLDTRLKLAKLMLLGGNLDESLKLINAAVQQDPKNSATLALKAGILLKLSDPTTAEEQARNALAIDPKNSDAITVLAAIRFAKNDVNEALAFLNSIPVSTPPDIGLSLFKIKVLEKKKDLAAVEKELKTLIASYPQEKAFKTALLQFYLINHRQDEAEQQLRAAATENPADIDAELELIGFLNSFKGPALAREQLVTRIKAGGNTFLLKVALAKLDYSQGGVDGAMKRMRELIGSESSKDNVLSAKVTLAEMFADRKNYGDAKPLLNEVVQADKGNVNALRLRATIHIAEGQAEDAVADLRQALNEQPRSPELLAQLSVAYEQQGSVELADKQLNDAARASNFAPNYSLTYSKFLQRRGNLAPAEDVLSECASRHPNDVAVLSQLARIRLQRQNWTGAQEIADQLQKIGDKSALSDEIQASALAGQQRYDDAIGILEGSYQANPGAVQPMLALVGAYLAAKQPAKAEAFLHSVLTASPRNAQALVMLGQVQLASNAPAASEASFKSAIQQDPKEISSYRALSQLYARQNRLDDALQVLRTGLQQDPKNMVLRLGVAGNQEAKHDIEGAMGTYESMLKDDPTSMLIANNLASLLSDYRSDKESLERAYSFASILAKAQVPQFKDTLGWINHLRGDNVTALQMLEEAARELPKVALVQFHLGATYQAVGQPQKATEQFKKAAELVIGQDDAVAQKIRAALKS